MKVAATFGIFIVTGLVFLAYSSSPPDGRTGAPGELTCGTAGCHGSNSGNGSLTLAGPDTYSPGDTLTLTVNLAQAGMSRWGFELTVLDDQNIATGDILITESARTQLSTTNNRQYLKHNAAGTDAGTADAAPGWTFKWASPSTGSGTATFYVAGNAANANSSSSGDVIYTTQKQVKIATGIADDNTVPAGFHLAQNYPNPFNPATTISYNIGTSAFVSLAIYDIRGQQVAQIVNSRQAAGEYSVLWDAGALSSGIYFARIQAGEFSATKRMTLLK